MPAKKVAKKQKKSLNETINPVFDVIVIDGNNVAYKYTVPPFTTFCNSKGEPTGILYGTLRFVKSMLTKYGTPATQLVYCCDGNESNVLRKAIADEYKANRDHSKDSPLFTQVAQFGELMVKYGFSYLIGEAEADDLAYTVVQQAKKAGKKVLLVSEDKDWEQMIDFGKVAVYKPRSKVMVTRPLDYSFPVYCAFVGDRADNIGSANICTPTVAMELAKAYNTVKKLLRGAELDDQRCPAVLEHQDTLLKREKIFKLYSCKFAEDVSLKRGKRLDKDILGALDGWAFSKVEQYLF